MELHLKSKSRLRNQDQVKNLAFEKFFKIMILQPKNRKSSRKKCGGGFHLQDKSGKFETKRPWRLDGNDGGGNYFIGEKWHVMIVSLLAVITCCFNPW